jgi:hypothetical protein
LCQSIDANLCADSFIGPHYLTLRLIKFLSRTAVMKTRDATHNTTSIARRYEAVGKEIPMPVARATYAATHTGHLGISASVALGMIQPAISPPRLILDAAGRMFSPARVLIWQQW